MNNIKGHELYGYNLKIIDDEYANTAAKYKKLAENVGECWRGFISICKSLQGEAIKGLFADKVAEYAEELGTTPGEDFCTCVTELANDMQTYISDIDAADGKLY
ncbi:MAG: hypothetical protein Q4G07_02190 [Oscillospiraceae bacterium]|nr:hypothetical protein [Oscillospiraceae bacterium]